MPKDQTSVSVPSGVWTKLWVGGRNVWVRHTADKTTMISVTLDNPNEEPVEHQRKNIFEQDQS